MASHHEFPYLMKYPEDVVVFPNALSVEERGSGYFIVGIV
jgi:hypothetical protein